MSNVIQFLESMGSRPLSVSDYAANVGMLDIDDICRQALLTRDSKALGGLLKGRAVMYCLVAMPDEESPESPAEPDEEQEPDEEGGKSPS